MSLAAKVFMSTQNLSREQWLQARKHGLGGSDVAKIALPNYRWGSPVTVYMDKAGELPDNDETSEAAELGTELEDFVAWKFMQKTGMKVRRCNQILEHPKYSWMLANVDRLIVSKNEGLECKTASEYLKDQWTDDEVPTAYFLQCQHYMAVTGYDKWWIAVLIGGNKFRYKCIDRDEAVIERIIQIESDFWNNHVIPGIPPEMDGSDASTVLLKYLHPESNGEEVELLPEAQKLIEDREYWKSQMNDAEVRMKASENKLKQMLGDCEIGRIGDLKVSWKSVTSNRIDSKLLKSELPDVYEKYTKPSVSRRFDIR